MAASSLFLWCARAESNCRFRLRRPTSYPLDYERFSQQKILYHRKNHLSNLLFASNYIIIGTRNMDVHAFIADTMD